MSQVAFWTLWSFVLVLPWDKLIVVPVLGSVPRIIGLVASVVGVLLVLARRRVRPLSAFHVFAVLFVLWAGVSTVWSLDPQATRIRFLTYLQLVMLTWLIWEIAWTPERQRALLQAYVLGVFVAALVTVQRYLAGVPMVGADYMYDPTRVSALSYNVNELGMTLALGLPMAWYLGISHARRRIRWLWRAYLPVGITAILLTASRGAFLAALVALAIIPLTFGHLRLGTRFALVVLSFVTLLLATHFVPTTSFARLETIRSDVAVGYFGGRGSIWAAGLEAAHERPFAGAGAGAYGAAVESRLKFAWGAHSVPLAILVENGLVGMFLLFAAFGAVIKGLWRLPSLEKRFSIVLLLTLIVGSLTLEWEDRKQFWFVLGVLAAEVAYYQARKSVAPTGAVGMRPAALNP
jgi:O-antigen ligase